MRLKTYFGLMAFAALALPAIAQDFPSHDWQEVRESGDPEGAPYRAFQVTGYGVTHEKAKGIAFQLAAEEIRKFIRESHPEFSWYPTPDFLLRRKITELPEAPNAEQCAQAEKCAVTLELRLTEQTIEELLKHDRIERSEERQWLWAKLLAGLTALLTLAAGYFRLEDATKGYLTFTLRLILIVGVVLTILGVRAWL